MSFPVRTLSVVCLLAVTGSSSAAQEIHFRGQVTALPRRQLPQAVRRPGADLSRTRYVSALPGTLHAMLTPSHVSEPGRASVTAFGVWWFAPQDTAFYLMDYHVPPLRSWDEHPKLILGIDTQPGGYYMVRCEIWAFSSTPMYVAEGGPPANPAEGTRIVPDAQSQVTLHVDNAIGSHAFFTFYSYGALDEPWAWRRCQIRKLN